MGKVIEGGGWDARDFCMQAEERIGGRLRGMEVRGEVSRSGREEGREGGRERSEVGREEWRAEGRRGGRECR